MHFNELTEEQLEYHLVEAKKLYELVKDHPVMGLSFRQRVDEIKLALANKRCIWDGSGQFGGI